MTMMLLPVITSLHRYNMATEFPEALEHHLERSRNTKIILKYDDAGGEEYA